MIRSKHSIKQRFTLLISFKFLLRAWILIFQILTVYTNQQNKALNCYKIGEITFLIEIQIIAKVVKQSQFFEKQTTLVPPSVHQGNLRKKTTKKPPQNQKNQNKHKNCLFLCFLGKSGHVNVVDNYVWKHSQLVKIYPQYILHNFRCRNDLMAAVIRGKVFLQCSET